MIKNHKGIPHVDQIYFGAYELIELDIYVYVACMRRLNGFNA